MPPPRSRGHRLVDLVVPYVGDSPSSPPVCEEIVTALQRELNEEFLEVPPESSLPNITISEQDLQYSMYNLFSNIVPESPTPGPSTVIEFIDHTETIISEPHDIALEDSSTTLIEPFFPSAPEILNSSNDPAAAEDSEHNLRDDTGSASESQRENNENDETESSARKALQAIVEDPDFLPEENHQSEGTDSNEEQKGRPKKGRKRKYPDQNRHIRKKRANTNEDYISAKGKQISKRKFKGTDFNCNCPLKCTEKVTLEQRETEFQRFWSAGSFEARCAMLQGSVQESQKKRSYKADSRRTFSRIYRLAKITVCKKTFLNTLSISQARVDSALKKYRSQASFSDKRGCNSGGRNAIPGQKLEEKEKIIESLPKYTSHYCRTGTTANFLAPNLNLTKIYDLYKEKVPSPVSFSKFRLCFYTDFNLRFKKPQKDTCFRCDRYKASKTGANNEQLEILENEHKDHLDRAYALRAQMKRDLTMAKTDPSVEALTFDLEKTHCLPRLPTSIVYYKRQLNLHNLGIHCGSTGQGYFHIWLEHEAGRGTQEVGSCLKKFVNEHLKSTVAHLILWSDSCGGQNRSIKMVLMLLHILHNHETLQNITLRFLQPGHTYLPNDSEFGDVECALKTQIRLYTPNDYITVMENCRRKNKFIVKRLQKEDFKSVAPIQERVTNRKTDIEKQKISWMNTFEIEVRKSDPTKLFMKTKLEDTCKVVDISKGAKRRRCPPNFEIDLPTLYPDGRELSEAKIKDLKEMLKLIPTDAKPFYSFLRNVRSNDFIDDTEGLGNTIDFEIDENELEE